MIPVTSAAGRDRSSRSGGGDDAGLLQVGKRRNRARCPDPLHHVARRMPQEDEVAIHPRCAVENSRHADPVAEVEMIDTLEPHVVECSPAIKVVLRVNQDGCVGADRRLGVALP